MLAGEGEEGGIMEKKPSNRPSSVAPKAVGTDTKRTENGNSSKFPRNARRREPGNSKPKYDQGYNRKPAPQKSRAMDKRPRNRGDQGDRQGKEMTMEDGAELGSALRPGSKKGNLNHLLNFSFAPRDNRENSFTVGRRGGNWYGRNKWSGKSTSKYNKEQFLQANCQFIVKDTGDYVAHCADPDTLVDWDLIEQVRIFSHEVPSCPICLYPPVAAKITRCGHIFCWTCILHYLSLDDKSWRKCPICYDSVHKDDLKSVVAMATRHYLPGDEIVLKLMVKEKGSTYAMPRSQWAVRDGKPHSLNDEIDECYAKLLMASGQQVQEIINCERIALETQMADEVEGSLEASFISAALELTSQREKSLIKITPTEGLENVSVEEAEVFEAELPERKPNKNLVSYTSAFDDEGTVVDETEGASENESPGPTTSSDPEMAAVSERPQLDMDDLSSPNSDPETAATESNETGAAAACNIEEAQGLDEARNDSTNNGTQSSQNTYYFYQAGDGQHIYIHSINARCLVKEYGSWEKCPDSITARIVEMEGFSMSTDLRRRLRYLSHLPLTCEFQIAELALMPPIVSKDTINEFADEIEKRKRMRQRKQRDEKRQARKMKEVENRQMGLGPGLRVSLGSSVHFPEYNSVDVLADSPALATADSNGSTPYGSPPQSGLNPNAVEFTPGSPVSVPSLGSTPEDSQMKPSMSFAQMLLAGKSKPTDAWPKVMNPTVGEVSRWERGVSGCSEDSEGEERAPAPVYQASFGDAIQEALDKYANKSDVTERPGKDDRANATDVTITGGKKKKNKKKLLFSTSMPRAK